MPRPALLSLLIALAACKGSKEERDTVAQICDKVLACGAAAWSDEEECQAGWLNNPDYGTDCAYTDDYLACAKGCLNLECAEFEDCESACWGDSCL